MYSGSRKPPPEPLAHVPHGPSTSTSAGGLQSPSSTLDSARSSSFHDCISPSSAEFGSLSSPVDGGPSITITTNSNASSTSINTNTGSSIKRTQNQNQNPSTTTLDQLFPSFRSALDFTTVRDFAYPDFHPLYYGVALKDRPKDGYGGNEEDEDDDDNDDDDEEDDDDDYNENNNTTTNNVNNVGRSHKAAAFADGPPWQEDSDLKSPVVTDQEGHEYEFSVGSADEIHGKAIALFDFYPENDNEVLLREGQIIWVSYRHGQGWLVAENPETGETGLVPEEYVQLLANADLTSYEEYQEYQEPAIYASPECDSEGWVDEDADHTAVGQIQLGQSQLGQSQVAHELPDQVTQDLDKLDLSQ